MYYDKDLLEFVKTNYPEYLALYQSLKGVYMADMARVLVVYHYGGIYMDLDFYCHRFDFIHNRDGFPHDLRDIYSAVITAH